MGPGSYPLKLSPNLLTFETKPTPNPFELKEVVYFLISFSSVKIGFNSFFLLKSDNVLLINVDLGLFVSVLINVFSYFDGMEPKFVLVKAV